MGKIQIDNSKYSVSITDKGIVKIYRCDEDVSNELNYNIVVDMAYMIDNLQKKLNDVVEDIDNMYDDITQYMLGSKTPLNFNLAVQERILDVKYKILEEME